MIECKPAPGKGLGVFASRPIRRAAVMETAPAKEFSACIRDMLSITDLGGMEFVDPEKYNPTWGAPNDGRLVFGLASLCNHADSPNARVAWRRDASGLWAELVALSNIPAGHEVTIRYTDIAAYCREGWAA